MTTTLNTARVQRAYVSVAAINGGEFIQERGETFKRYAWRIDQIVSQSPRERGELRRLRQVMKAGFALEPIVLFRETDGSLSIVDGLMRTAAAAMISRAEIEAVVYTPATDREADFVSEVAFHAARLGKALCPMLQAVSARYTDQGLAIAA